MHLPLATLRRQNTTVRLVRRGLPSGGVGETSEPLAFRDLEEAERYLSFWLNDQATISQLRRALSDAGDLGALWQRSDREVARALASRLLGGSLLLMVEQRPYRPWGERIVPPAELEETAWQDVIRPAPSPAPAPLATPAAAVLPLLEEVQIEGAWVLPEVLQTLEQIDLTLQSLELAGLSLEPTPSGVPAISAAMQKASASATATLDGL